MALSAISTAFQSVLNDVYENGVSAKNAVPFKLFDAYYQNLKYAIGGHNVERDIVLQNNIAQFAAVKTANLMKELDRVRVEDNGVLLSRKDFEAEAKKIGKAYNRYQTAEYNTAVHRNRVVKQWEQFQKEKHLYPNVQWLRTRSANPRDLHLQYAGRIWSMDDPFLRDNFPGCIWNCKCGWKTTRADVTDNSDIKEVKPSPGLEGNPYYTNEIFSKEHQYYKQVEKQPHIAKLGSLWLPDEFAYVEYMTDKGDRFKIHHLAIDEYKEANKPFVQHVIDSGYKDVQLLPEIKAVEKDLRQRYYEKFAPGGLCPDAVCNGTYIEFKEVVKTGKKMRRNIVNHIGDAAKKADVVFIKLPKKMNENELKELSDKMFNVHASLERIVYINIETQHSYTR